MKINFKELKSKVGVVDIALTLGYKIDRKAGVGRYVELVLGDRRDRIIVSFPNDRSRQTFFRRNGERGDVLDLIRENLNSFNVFGKTEWEKIAKVLMKQANIPIEITSDRSYIESNSVAKEFDAERYAVKDIEPTHTYPILRARSFSMDTVAAFRPFISLIRDESNEKFKGYNIGFPYTEGGEGRVCGYEIRGANGYKQKASGTNSSTASWMADFAKVKGNHASEILLFESAFDAMAFYQANAHTKSFEYTALVSIGGTFSNGQIRKIVETNPNARFVDCFDNDKAGRIYGLRLLAILNNKPIKIATSETEIELEWGEQLISVPNEALNKLTQYVSQTADVDCHIGEWRAPQGYKDWNDYILGNKMEEVLEPNKYQRNENLEQRRKGGVKV